MTTRQFDVHEFLDELKSVVDHQAAMKTLWTPDYVLDFPDAVNGPTVVEARLRSALRHLHAVIEGHEDMAMVARQEYWNLESEM